MMPKGKKRRISQSCPNKPTNEQKTVKWELGKVNHAQAHQLIERQMQAVALKGSIVVRCSPIQTNPKTGKFVMVTLGKL